MAEAPIAATKAGKVRGAVEDGVNVFKGIRYGVDTATTRFEAPRPPTPWSDVKDALAYGASTLQAQGGDGGGLFKSWRQDPPLPMSEDCLWLNVWTRGLRDGKKRPVMVWLHGGGFVTGSGSSYVYDGVRLCNRGDVIVISINHRLNMFGHLYLGEYGFADSGNAGILDIIQALHWVRDNAAEFGGDAGNVTIFGESGGGSKVCTLMAMEAATGLFHRGICQSGPMPQATTAADATKSAEMVIAELGLTRTTIDQIRTMPAAQIQKAVRAAQRAGARVAGTGPVIDDRNLKRHPFTPDAPNISHDVPLMIGTNRTETSMLIGAARRELFDLTWDTLPAALSETMKGRDTAKIVAEYRKLHPSRTAVDSYFTMTTDGGFYRLSVQIADRKSDAGGAPVYFYLLNWNTPVDGGKWLCPHSLDITFCFDNVAKSESMSGIGADQQKLADMMSEAWLAFAKTGNPNSKNVPNWPAYDSKSRATMIFDLEPKVVNDPRAADRKIIENAKVAVR